jgi:hypothetical protein
MDIPKDNGICKAYFRCKTAVTVRGTSRHMNTFQEETAFFLFQIQIFGVYFLLYLADL